MTNQETIRALILESVSATPGRLSEIAVELSSWYATLAEEMLDIEVFMADKWIELRKDTKSDAMATRQWDATEEGKTRNRLKTQLKYIEKIVSSIKFRLKIKEGESFGRY